MTLRRFPLAFAAGFVALAALVSAVPARAADTVNIVAYSTVADAYKTIIPAFQKTPAGKGVKFTQSYGASGDQSRAIVAGQKADIIHLALEPDVTRLVPNVVAPSWSNAKYKGIVANSVVVFVVRKGNRKHIKSWGDLIKPDVKVVTADPISSGGARWNALAAYGAALRENKHSTQAAFDYLKKFFQHTPTRPPSARDALTLFSKGYGDVLVTYESEAIYANHHGVHYDYVIPKDNDPRPDADRARQASISRGPRVLQVPLHADGAADLRKGRVPLGDPVAGQREGLSEAEATVHDQQLRRLDGCEPAVLHAEGGPDRQGAGRLSHPPGA